MAKITRQAVLAYVMESQICHQMEIRLKFSERRMTVHEKHYKITKLKQNDAQAHLKRRNVKLAQAEKASIHELHMLSFLYMCVFEEWF